MAINMNDPEEKLSTARMSLVMTKRFWGFLALKMPFIACEHGGGQGTTAVDEYGRFYYNPEHIKKMPFKDVVFELGHEVMHLVQRCAERFPPNADRGVWNVAADYVVDTILEDAGFTPSAISLKMIPKEIRDKVRGKTTEQVYFMLLKEGKGQSDKGKGKSKAGQGEEQGGHNPLAMPKDQEHPDNTRGCHSASHLKKMSPKDQIKWKQAVIAAVQHAQQFGKGDIPGWMQDFIAEVTRPSVTWKDYIRRLSMSVFRNRYNMKRPGRRSHAIGVRLPSKLPSPEGAIIAIDTSGSISDEDLNQFVSESVEIMRASGCHEVSVYFHDVQCYYHGKYTKDTIKNIKVTRGGTSHIDVFQKIEENEKKIGMVVCFTDLMTNFPTKEPDYPVVWASTPAGKSYDVPWGTKVMVELEKRGET